MALVENIQREDLTAVEEAKAYVQIMRQAGFTQEQVAERVGKSQSAVANKIRLLNLPEEIQNGVMEAFRASCQGIACSAGREADECISLYRRTWSQCQADRGLCGKGGRSFQNAQASEDQRIYEKYSDRGQLGEQVREHD